VSPERARHRNERDEQRYEADRHQGDRDTWVPSVDEHATGEEPSWDEEKRSRETRARDGMRGSRHRADRQSVRDVEQPEERPVRVGEPPHEPARFAFDVEVGRDLERVHRLEREA